MSILGLDVSTIATGWAILASGNDSLVSCDVIETRKDMTDDQKLLYITESVDTLIKTYRHITELAIEDTFMGKNPVVVKKLNRIAGAISHIWYLRKGRPANFYMATSARKAFDISGKSTKEEIIKAVNSHYGLRLKNHNTADAIVVAHCHLKKVHWEFPGTGGESPKDVPKKARRYTGSEKKKRGD